ncbi:MAG: transposase [Candidatus Midichloria sp.]|nr:transposase [Candidatus Midichloria sp.]
MLAAFKQLLLAGSGLIETAIGQLKKICQILYTTTSLAKQINSISWKKISSQAYSLRQIEVI